MLLFTKVGYGGGLQNHTVRKIRVFRRNSVWVITAKTAVRYGHIKHGPNTLRKQLLQYEYVVNLSMPTRLI